MLERDQDKPLTGERIEVDDADIGASARRQTRPGSAGKTPFVAAVETTAEAGRCGSVPVANFRRFRSKAGGAPSASRRPVYSDGLNAFHGISYPAAVRFEPRDDAGLPSADRHGSGKKRSGPPPSSGQHPARNLKTSLAGTFHAIRDKHVPRYLTQFQYSFNRRYDLAAMIPRLGWAAVRTPPMPYRLLKLAGK